MLRHLFAHQIKPEFTCCFQREPNSIAFWDNRTAQHHAVNDYQGFKRLMHGITQARGHP